MRINNEPILFSTDQIRKIETLRKAKYVCATEYKERSVEVFYGDEVHVVSGSRYFALYFACDSVASSILMITNGAFIEDQEIDGVISNDGEIVYSRHRHDYRSSRDGSVFIDGGRAYTRTNVLDASRRVTLIVREGVLKVKNEE